MHNTSDQSFFQYSGPVKNIKKPVVDKVHSLLGILNIPEPSTQISTKLLAKKSPKTGVVQHICT